MIFINHKSSVTNSFFQTKNVHLKCIYLYDTVLSSLMVTRLYDINIKVIFLTTFILFCILQPLRFDFKFQSDFAKTNYAMCIHNIILILFYKLNHLRIIIISCLRCITLMHANMSALHLCQVVRKYGFTATIRCNI